MSEIIKQVQASMGAFLDAATLPDALKEDVTKRNYDKLVEKAETEKKRLKAEQTQLSDEFNSIDQIHTFYLETQADKDSLKADNCAIGQLLEDRFVQLAQALKKMEEPGFTALSGQLVACTKEANQMNKHFKEISSILLSLKGDLNPKVGGDDVNDVAYANLVAALKKKDEEAAKAAKGAKEQPASLVELLSNFKPSDVEEDITNKVAVGFKDFYGKLINLSLEFQKKLLPKFSRLGGLQPSMLAGLTAMKENLSTSMTEVSTVYLAEASEIQANRSEIVRLEAFIKSLEELEKMDKIFPDPVKEAAEKKAKEEARKKEEEARQQAEDQAALAKNNNGKKNNGNKEASGLDAPQIKDPIKNAISFAKERITYLQNNSTDGSEQISVLTEVIKAKDDFNAKIETRKKMLVESREISGALKEGLEELAETTSSLQKEISTLADDFSGTSAKSPLSAFVESLKTLSTHEASINTLNDAISSVEVEGDIKVYFKRLAEIMATFPASISIVVQNALAINVAFQDIKQWTANLQEYVVGGSSADNPSLYDRYRNSSWQMDSKDGKTPSADLKKIMSSLENAIITDEKALKTRGSALEAAKTADDKERARMAKERDEAKPSVEDKPTTLAEWQDYFEKRNKENAAMEKEENEKVTFLQQLEPEAQPA